MEIFNVQEMLEEDWMANNKTVVKMYNIHRNLLTGDPKSQWDRVYHKMCKRDSWAGVNGQTTTGRCLHL
jgi:hypothetical protein